MKEEDKRMKKIKKDLEKINKPKNVRVRTVKKKEPLNAEEMKIKELEDKKKEEINKVRKINEEMEMMGMEDNRMKKLETDIIKRARNKYSYSRVMNDLNTKAKYPEDIVYDPESIYERGKRSLQLKNAYMIKLKKGFEKLENRKGRKSLATLKKIELQKKLYQDIISGKRKVNSANFRGVPEKEQLSVKNKLLRAAKTK